MLRRRFAAGGADVDRARSSVARAARIDLGLGNLAAGLGRTLVGRGPAAAVDVLAAHGAQLARGASYADIALTLFVSANTVKTHVTSLYAKLGAKRRADALATARALDLLQPRGAVTSRPPEAGRPSARR